MKLLLIALLAQQIACNGHPGSELEQQRDYKMEFKTENHAYFAGVYKRVRTFDGAPPDSFEIKVRPLSTEVAVGDQWELQGQNVEVVAVEKQIETSKTSVTYKISENGNLIDATYHGAPFEFKVTPEGSTPVYILAGSYIFFETEMKQRNAGAAIPFARKSSSKTNFDLTNLESNLKTELKTGVIAVESSVLNFTHLSQRMLISPKLSHAKVREYVQQGWRKTEETGEVNGRPGFWLKKNANYHKVQ